jgi:hypothetical protein
MMINTVKPVAFLTSIYAMITLLETDQPLPLKVCLLLLCVLSVTCVLDTFLGSASKHCLGLALLRCFHAHAVSLSGPDTFLVHVCTTRGLLHAQAGDAEDAAGADVPAAAAAAAAADTAAAGAATEAAVPGRPGKRKKKGKKQQQQLQEDMATLD